MKWLKVTGLLLVTLAFGLSGVVALLVAIAAAVVGLVPVLVVLLAGWYLTAGSRWLRRINAPVNPDLPADFVRRVTCTCNLFLRDPTPAELAACPIHRPKVSGVHMAAAFRATCTCDPEAGAPQPGCPVHDFYVGASTRPSPPKEPVLPPRRVYNESEIPKD